MRIKNTILTFCLLAGSVCATAQEKLDNDPEIKVGKLENGMTYYLRQNSNPKGCADFYIAHNVGYCPHQNVQQIKPNRHLIKQTHHQTTPKHGICLVQKDKQHLPYAFRGLSRLNTQPAFYKAVGQFKQSIAQSQKETDPQIEKQRIVPI